MRVALAQLTTGPSPSDNARQVCQLISEASGKGAQLVAFPEATSQAFGTGRLDHNAECIEDFLAPIRQAAQEHSIAVVVGGFTPADKQEGRNRVHNTLFVVLPDGTEHRYNKRHCYDAFGFKESDNVKSGETNLTFTYEGVCWGVATCYDIRFPQQFKQLARAGAQAIIVSASWQSGPGKVRQWNTLGSARAMDSTCVVFAVDQADPETQGITREGPCGVGNSGVFLADGTPSESLGAEPGLLIHDLDVEGVDAVRKTLPVLADD
ncbi:nitrilase-related carbon-nitrogen hydrolase [Corynebacterium argentoratense]